MAEFVQLTQVERRPYRCSQAVSIRKSDVRLIHTAYNAPDDCGSKLTLAGGMEIEVAESPALVMEVLALLSAGEARGADGIEDVVEKLKKQASWYDTDPVTNGDMFLDGEYGGVTISDLRKLVSFLDTLTRKD